MMFENDGTPQGGLMRLYKTFSNWCLRRQRRLVVWGHRSWRAARDRWCPCVVWRAATGCGIVGLLLMVGLIANELFRSTPAIAKEVEQKPFTVPIESFAPDRPAAAPIVDHVPRPQLSLATSRLGTGYSPLLIAAVDNGPTRRPEFAFGYAWESAFGKPLPQARPLAHIGPIASYTARRDVQIDLLNVTDAVGSSDVAPVAASRQSSQLLAFEAVTLWPREIMPGEPTMLELRVRNASGQAVEQVRVTHTLDPFDRVTDTLPPAGVLAETPWQAGQLVWDESDWPADETRSFRMTVVSDGRPIRGTAAVEMLSAFAVASVTEVDTLAPDPNPVLPFDQPLPADEPPATDVSPLNNLEVLPADPFPSTPPEQEPLPPGGTRLRIEMTLLPVSLGEPARATFRVINTGPAVSQNTKLLVTLPASYKHPAGRDLILRIGEMTVGQVFETDLQADVLDTDDLRVTAAAVADNSEKAQTTGAPELNP